MIKKCISSKWAFSTRNSNVEIVDLPHDYAISSVRTIDSPGGRRTGFFNGEDGKYVKYIRPQEYEHTILDIDGAYMCAHVRINEQLLAIHPYGYTPFLVDITDYLRFGRDNQICIETFNLQPSTRWYTGAGLYRDVYLWTGGSVRIEPWDMFVSAVPTGGDSAEITIKTDLMSDVDAEVDLKLQILDASGTEVAAVSQNVCVSKEKKTGAVLKLKLNSAILWDLDNPYLYTAKAEVSLNGENTDVHAVDFGIRSISADTTNGFMLNGKSVKMRGGCIHHDHGAIGASSFPAAEERKIRLLKEAGFNAVRCAHNPQSTVFLETCDRLGMLVMEEAFDMWNEGFSMYDYHLWFADWWERDIRSMVMRDRNHPSVISYSTGNEIIEHSGKSNGAMWSRMLADEIRKYDNTRFVTNAVPMVKEVCDENASDEYKEDFLLGYADMGDGSIESSWAQRTEEFIAPLDITGYNYLYPRYGHDGKLYPNRVIWGSETKVTEFYDSWQETMKFNHVIGDFTWTAYDNLGEAGAGISKWASEGECSGLTTPRTYPWRSCYQGDLDACLYRKPQSYYREAVWIGGDVPYIFTTHPKHFGEGFSGTGWHWFDVNDTWTFEEEYIGKPVKVDVYTDADEVVFLVNNNFICRSNVENCIATADINYEKGTLKAIIYREGKECGSATLQTVGQPYALNVEAESNAFIADNRDLCFFKITVVDEDGVRVPDSQIEITCEVEGGQLMCIYSGDPCNEDQYGSNTCHAFKGRALAVVRASCPGDVFLKVYAQGMSDAKVIVSAKQTL